MKNTIKNTVSEVYNTNFKNDVVQVLYKSPSPDGEINGFNAKYQPNAKELLADNTSFKLPVYTILLFFTFFIILILGYVYRMKLKDFVHSILKRLQFVNETKSKVHVKEATKNVEEPKEKVQETKQNSIVSLKHDVNDKNTITDKTKSENSNIKKDPPVKQYSPKQMVNEHDRYCYIGQDDNMRNCINVYKGEVCTSGDIYNRIDDCLLKKTSYNLS